MLGLQNLQNIILVSALLLPSAVLFITLHELAHAWVADLQGDRTPRIDGRLSLDPRHHLDAYGFLAVFLTFGLHIGWGRTPKVDSRRLAGKLGEVGFSLAGPCANLLAAVATGLAVRILSAGQCFLVPGPPGALQLILDLLQVAFYFNLVLVFFHLLPIPGLDGYRVLDILFRRSNPRLFWWIDSNRTTIWVVCAVLVLVLPGLLGTYLGLTALPLGSWISGCLPLI